MLWPWCGSNHNGRSTADRNEGQREGCRATTTAVGPGGPLAARYLVDTELVSASLQVHNETSLLSSDALIERDHETLLLQRSCRKFWR